MTDFTAASLVAATESLWPSAKPTNIDATPIIEISKPAKFISPTDPARYGDDGVPILDVTKPTRFITSNDSVNGFGSHFLEVIGRWSAAIPIHSFWVVVVTIPASVRTWVEKFKTSSWDGTSWEDLQMSVYDNLLDPLFSEKNTQQDYIHGCFFARSISLPGEKIDMTSVNFNNGGLLFPQVERSRNTQNSIAMSFLETNASYVDSVLRPWNIVFSYLGLVPRANSIKGNIQAFFYTKNYSKNSSNKAPKKRKIFTFNDVVPVSINNEECQQRAGDALIERPVSFYYSTYSVSNKDIVDLIST